MVWENMEYAQALKIALNKWKKEFLVNLGAISYWVGFGSTIGVYESVDDIWSG